MNQPLGYAVGNALELKEAIQTLDGGGPHDFREHCLVVASHMLAIAGVAPDLTAGRAIAQEAIDKRRGMERFRSLVAAQGGDVSYVDHPEKLPQASLVEDLPAERGGYLTSLNARIIGESSLALGAGRTRKDDPIDYAVGLVVHYKVGDRVEAGEPLFTIHANDETRLEEARSRLMESITWSDSPVEPLPLFYGVVDSEG
jgi:pyrimidine-nucleoside phosphorylase